MLEVEVKILKVILSKIKYFLSKESCYTEMERRGIASMGCCCGVVGGTSSTNYLSESCCDCKYFTLIGDEWKWKCVMYAIANLKLKNLYGEMVNGIL